MRSRQEKSNSILACLYGIFSSIKTTVSICLFLAMVSLVGTLIRQNASPQEYLQEYGPGVTKLFGALGLFDLYHSKGFTILLLLLALNLVCCSVKNLPRVWRISFRPRRIPTPEALAARKLSERVHVSMSPSETVEKVSRTMEGVLGRVQTMETGEGAALHFRRGSFSRLGSFITHLGVLLILAGAMVGSLFGFRGYVNISEGGEASSIRLFGSGARKALGFTVVCDGFLVEHYENGMPKEYRSELVIREGRKEIMRKSVLVNDPLTYRGVTFYQASYGEDPGAEVDLGFKGKTGGKKGVLTAHVGEEITVPGYGDRIRVLQFVRDLAMPATEPRGSPRSLGPAVQIIVFREKGHSRPYWLLQEYPDFQAGAGRPIALTLEKVRTRYYTGLQVTKDPGTTIVWIGCTVMILGLIVAFYFSEKEMWALVRPEKGGSSVTVAGWASKNPESFRIVFEKAVGELRKALAVPVSQSGASK